MLIAAASGAERDEAARRFLRGRSPRAPLLIVANSLEAGQRLLRDAVVESAAGALFGWQVESLATLTGKLAGNALAAAELTPASGFALEALCARLVFELAQRGELGRFARVADRPGLPRAFARTLSELALAGVPCTAPGLDPDLGRVYERYRAALAQAQLADPAQVLEIAAEVARARAHALCGLPLLLWDLRVAERAECALLTAFAAHAPERLTTAHVHDARSLSFLEEALGAPAQHSAIDPARAADSALYRLQQQLFAPPVYGGALGSEVALLSAPGEGRECVEIARRALQEAERGMRFDRMAILLRAPELYRVPLLEALRRARIPAHFTRGTLQPDRSGRALLALLACAGEELSARRFAEYLSLGVVPRRDPSGAPPAALSSADAFVAPSAGELAGALAASASAEEPAAAEARAAADELPAPRRWERLLVSAAVLSGKARWRVRLDALERELGRKLASEVALDEARRGAVERELGALRSLRAFALPLIDALAELPAQARWGEWIDALCALATRAIAEPAALQGSLRELAPMAEVGPLGLGEVRLVLERRLGEQLVRASATPAGKLLVAGIDEVRGLGFDLVFVPGLAEKIFPKKLNEDPLLLDSARAPLSPDLETAEARIAGERAALQLAVSAARARVVLSFPRFAADRARPRVPSFYALEVLRAAEGKLPTQGELQQRATEAADARMGWPAPREARAAIDAAEYDLVVLHGFLHGTGTGADWSGAANYLLECNPHLGRALRFRARRWHSKWHKADGLVLQQPDETLLGLLKEQLPSERAYSATALERFAVCPYRFYLSAIVGLRKRDEPEAIESMPAHERGMLVHAVLRALLHELRATDELPITDHNLAQALARLDLTLEKIAADYRERLAPAIARVWDEGVAEIRADLRKWLALAAERPDWTPAYFELAFGLRERGDLEEFDPASTSAGVKLGIGLLLKGSIDLVERSGEVLRAVDYKTGAMPPQGHYLAIDGGRALQPVLYALALEQIFPGSEVRAGEAYYCSARGGWKRIEVVLDPRARGSAQTFVTTLEQAIAEGFLPAAPARDACERCEFSPICGPYEAQRVSQKDRRRLEPLKLLRSEP